MIQARLSTPTNAGAPAPRFPPTWTGLWPATSVSSWEGRVLTEARAVFWAGLSTFPGDLVLLFAL